MLKLGLFFTRGVGLGIWQRDGIIDRELAIFRELAARQITTTLFAYDHSARLELLASQDEFACVPITRAALTGRFRRARPQHYAIRHHLRTIDLIRTNQFVGGDEAVAAASFFDTPLIARAGFVHSLNATLAGASLAKITTYQAEERALLTRADAVIVTTSRLREYVCDTYAVPAEIVHVVGNYVPDYFRPPQNDCEKSSATATCHVLTIGRHHPEKGYDLLIAALAGQSNITWRAVGAGNGFAPDAEKAARADVKTEFTARTPNREIPATIHAADIFVLCSEYEGHPKALLEAMACGAACIVTDAPGVASEISHEQTGLIVPRTAEALRAAILRLRDDAPLRKKLGVNAAQYIHEHYRLSTIAACERNIYEAVLQKSAMRK